MRFPLEWMRQRRVTNVIRWIIDNLLPPIISDARWFNRIVAYVMFGGQPFDLDYKENPVAMTPPQLGAYHEVAFAGWKPYRPSDTTEGQVRRIWSCPGFVDTSTLR